MRKLESISGIAFKSGPVIIWVIIIGFLLMHWQAIPDTYPVHQGRGGNADAWVHKSFLGIVWPLAIPLFLYVLALVTAQIPKYVGTMDHRRDPFMEKAFELILFAVTYLASLLTGAIALSIPFHSVGGSIKWLPLIITLAVFALFEFIMMIIYLVSTKEQPKESKGDSYSGNRKDKSFWKWGQFYHNPDDPALWVEKRGGGGYTLNMAHRAS